jgi:alpha-glucosidase
LRVVIDGEPQRRPARLERSDAAGDWYAAELPQFNPSVGYRWLVVGGQGYQWVNGEGTWERDVTDASDFHSTTFEPPPAWAASAVGYQIFPDRFARSEAASGRELPAWADPAGWDDEPLPTGMGAGRQFYGGDLAGIADHAQYLAGLGVNLVYLTPFFPATSSHRYDAATFDHVDPLLGGDEALAGLARVLHQRGIRLIGDLTTNHTGWTHDWFQAARADRTSPEAGFYYWTEDRHIDFEAWQAGYLGQAPDPEKRRRLLDAMLGQGAEVDYFSWLGIPSLPKLNWRSAELAARFIAGPDSIAARYLAPPFALDGWRIDVANMTGRFAADDLNHRVARRLRATLKEANPDALLVAEHFHDARGDLDRDGWQANMNYTAFTTPIWSWLADPAAGFQYPQVPARISRRPGGQAVAAMRQFDAPVAWKTKARQWNMLGSHDTPRILSLTGSPERAEVAAAWLFSYPGLPALFAGDEGGATGTTGEHARTTMPWDQIAAGSGPRWDPVTFAIYQDLIGLRRRDKALQDGSLRWAAIADDAVAFLRETPDERVLVVLARAAWEGVTLPGWLAEGTPERLYGPRRVAAPDVKLAADGLAVAGDGPAIGIWRLK